MVFADDPHPDPIIAQTVESLRDDIDAPASRASGVRAVAIPVLIVILIMAISGAVAYSYLKRDIRQTNGELSTQGRALNKTQQQLEDTNKVASKLSNQLRQNGIKPSVSVSPITPVPGPTGARGLIGQTGPAPSFVQIQRAVAFCFAAGQCAASPTRQQVADAVAKYCTANGECRGPTGKTGFSGQPGSSGDPGTPGTPGSSGATGPAGPSGPAGADGKDGAAGPPPTDSQVLEAVTTYCSGSTNPCQGDKGDTGYPASITIIVPDLTAPDGSRTETCTPDEKHVYTCK